MDSKEKVNSKQITLQEKQEILAKFAGGKYWAIIKNEHGISIKVHVDISEIEVRKALGYQYQFSFNRDYNWITPLLFKIQSLGFRVTLKNNSIIIYKEGIECDLVICRTISKHPELSIDAVFNVIYKFIAWYNQNKILKMIGI